MSNSPGERIKHMNIVTEAEGYVLLISAIQCRATEPERSSSYLHMAVKKFEEVLSSNTHSKVLLNRFKSKENRDYLGRMNGPLLPSFRLPFEPPRMP